MPGSSTCAWPGRRSAWPGRRACHVIAVSPPGWAAIEGNPAAPRASFLSLLDWRESWHGRGQSPYTPSGREVLGVEAACDQLLAEGLAASIARHATAARACRAGVAAMGLRAWPASEDVAAASVAAIAVPGGLDHVALRDHARARYGVMLADGQGAGNLIRIGHMGPTASGLYPVIALMALGRSLADLGVPVRTGEGAEAALAVLSAAAAS